MSVEEQINTRGDLSHELHGDLSLKAIVDTAALTWAASPSPSVWRKRLELRGPLEAGRVTSLVRYDTGSAFPSHPHPGGEEILVLSGVFSDESGDYPAGSFLLNPEGFVHAPRSADGCILLVKLRQSAGDRTPTQVNSRTARWHQTQRAGVEELPLYNSRRFPETIHLTRMSAGSSARGAEIPAGEEIFVMSGSFSDESGSYAEGTWIRFPPGSCHSSHTDQGCTLYVKRGHLAPLQ